MAGTLVIDTLKSSTTGPTVFQNTSGTEIGKLCRAWVYFNGSAATITSSYNVSSITRNSTGNYTANFTNALADALSVICGSGPASTAICIQSSTASSYTFSVNATTTGSAVDVSYCTVAFFR